ncbi:MAG: hypothetical protein CL607_24820 [Anaerolineaceae bacterium]|nr:hypothetical protein [Anaerolineaceae bacterium]
MSKARERIAKRRARQMATQRRPHSSVQAQDTHQTKLQAAIQQVMATLAAIPRNRLVLLIAALVVIGAVVAALALIKPQEEVAAGNGYWLNREWSYVAQEDARVQALVNELKTHHIDQLYVYLSSLKGDGTWAGDPTLRDRYSEVEPNVSAFIEQLTTYYPEAQIYAWIEVIGETPTGYRLDDRQLHVTVAEFAGRAIRTPDIEGVMLDIKPIFTDNDDLPVLLRAVRAEIGLDSTLAVVASPDLTPTEADINVAAFIAPDTMWSNEYKQRIALQADQLIVTAYNSYLTEPVDYINWVTHQVRSYTEMTSNIEGGAHVIISIPNYGDMEPAHIADIESIAAALDGISRAIPDMTEREIELLQGVAIYSDAALSSSDWQAYDQRWPRE